MPPMIIISLVTFCVLLPMSSYKQLKFTKKGKIENRHSFFTRAVEAVAGISIMTGTGKASITVGAVCVFTAVSVIVSTFIDVCHNTTWRDISYHIIS